MFKATIILSDNVKLINLYHMKNGSEILKNKIFKFQNNELMMSLNIRYIHNHSIKLWYYLS